jgi:transglutaminase-like putative cysteine protease
MTRMRLRGEYSVYSDEDRIQMIANLIEEGSKSPFIRELALKIVKDVPEKAWLQEAKAIFEWVKENIKYRRDVFCKDSYHTAERIVELGSGDCDDMVILMNSLLCSIGFRTGARIISSRPDRGFHHIYSLVEIPGDGWYALDATDKSHAFGEEPVWVKKRDFVFEC